LPHESCERRRFAVFHRANDSRTDGAQHRLSPSGLEAVVLPFHEVDQELLPPGIIPHALRAPCDRHSFGLYAVINFLPAILDVVCGPQVEHESHVVPIAFREKRLNVHGESRCHVAPHRAERTEIDLICSGRTTVTWFQRAQPYGQIPRDSVALTTRSIARI